VPATVTVIAAVIQYHKKGQYQGILHTTIKRVNTKGYYTLQSNTSAVNILHTVFNDGHLSTLNPMGEIL
jgi:hypothetical protein